jgi:predicted nucleic acid-binding protein
VTIATIRIVVADANVLINLMHVARLGFCSDLPGLEFMVPDHVRQEITQPGQRAELDLALESGALKLASITDPGDIGLFADLITRLGRGEAACLVLAERNGWALASDEKRRFRREAVRRIGEERLIGTADLFVRAIQAGLITVEEADADKESLASKRFKMPFPSFRAKLRSLSEESS